MSGLLLSWKSILPGAQGCSGVCSVHVCLWCTLVLYITRTGKESVVQGHFLQSELKLTSPHNAPATGPTDKEVLLFPALRYPPTQRDDPTLWNSGYQTETQDLSEPEIRQGC